MDSRHGRKRRDSRRGRKRRDSRSGRKRMNVEVDRLSSLPDDLIHKILSYVGIKQAMETSVLSSKWRFIWTSMSDLNFSTEDFSTLPKFSSFVNHVLSRLSNLMGVSSVNLSFRGKASQVFVKRILNYAFSHNVQQMTINCLHDKVTQFPLSLLRSQSLKHLTFTGSSSCHFYELTSTWELPALTTLNLNRVMLYVDNTDKSSDLFSKCENLKDLTLNQCNIMGSICFTICHPRLSNLTVENDCWVSKVVTVDAPQLKNLTIMNCEGKHVISAPDLTYLLYKCRTSFPLFDDGLPSLEKVDLCIRTLFKKDAHKIVGLLKQFHSVNFLTLNFEIIEVLSSCVDLISHEPSPFSNLKALKIYPEYVDSEEQLKMSTEVKNFLLDSSASATLTMISREEIRAVRNTRSAQNLMAKLQVLLDQEKAKTNGAHKAKLHDQGTKTEVNNGGMMAQIERCWEDLTMQIQLGKSKTWPFISKLNQIEELLTKLPASKRATIQPYFSSLRAEADTVINKIMDSMKIEYAKKQIHLSACLHELATTSQPSY